MQGCGGKVQVYGQKGPIHSARTSSGRADGDLAMFKLMLKYGMAILFLCSMNICLTCLTGKEIYEN